MKIPIIKYNDNFLKLFSWFGPIEGITLWPFIILREIYDSSDYYRNVVKKIIIHERIHIKQQIELLFIGFYILYLLEFLIKFVKYFNKLQTYKNLSFEKEAHENENNPDYIKTRPFFAWVKYL